MMKRPAMGWSWLLAAGLACAAAGAEKKVVIRGSNTFGEELAGRLIKAYQALHPGATFDLTSEGTGAGLADLFEGRCDLAAASRPINNDELRLARSRGIKLKPHPVGYYGVGVLVHADNPVRNLNDVQVADLFTGRIKFWKQIGGKNRPVKLFIRNPMSGTHLGFRELAMGNRPYAKSARELKSYRAIEDAVAADPDAVGYTGAQQPTSTVVRLVKINGYPLNAASVNEGFYPYARLLRLYSRSDRESEAVRDFLQFLRSKTGRKVLEEAGYVATSGKAADLKMDLGY